MKRLISADELKSDILSKMYLAQKEYLHKSHIIHQIDIAPTVDAVEVVHGRWKGHKPDCRGYTAGFICSCCGHITYTDYCMKECEYNYCPNCGAKMDGDGNG